MPATDRLLQQLRDTLGEEPTRDLVSWVNEAGTVNRAEVREIADLYLSRFDERLERRLAEMDVRLERRFAEVRVEMAVRLSAQYRDLLRWLFVFWAGTIIPLAGLMIALIKL